MYEINLGFNENFNSNCANSSRVFSVLLNDAPISTLFTGIDVFQATGTCNSALIRSVRAQVEGELKLTFLAVSNNAFVSTIDIATVVECAAVGGDNGGNDHRAHSVPGTYPEQVNANSPQAYIDFDGDGFARYTDCSSDPDLYDELSSVFEKCALGCISERGCPKSCCFSLIGGSQLLFCETPGRCLRYGYSTSKFLGWVSLEDLTSPENEDAIVCPLSGLDLKTEIKCAVKFNDVEEFVCSEGLDIPNTSELVIPLECDVNGTEPTSENKIPSPEDLPPIIEEPFEDEEPDTNDSAGQDASTDDEGVGPTETDESDSSTSATSDSSGSGSSACFPGDAMVAVQGKGLLRMTMLEVGDHVLVGENKFSEVFMFTHRLDDGILREFVRIETTSGATIELSKGHYIYAEGKQVEASKVRVGDLLLSSTGQNENVASLSTVFRAGLFNPQTLDGNIVVNGLTCSAYTSSFPAPWIAHNIILAPCKALNTRYGSFCGTFLEGHSRIGESLREAWKFFMTSVRSADDL